MLCHTFFDTPLQRHLYSHNKTSGEKKGFFKGLYTYFQNALLYRLPFLAGGGRVLRSLHLGMCLAAASELNFLEQ